MDASSLPKNSGRPAEITPLDHYISSSGGTTSTIENLPHRLQITKRQPRPTTGKRLEELVRENGYLRQELALQKELLDAMVTLHGKTVDAYKTLKLALREISQKRMQSEQRLLEYWGLDIGDATPEITIL